MDHTPPPTSLAAALGLPRTLGRSAEVFVDGDLEVRFAARPTNGPQVPHLRDELYFVAAGSGRYRVEDKVSDVGPGDLLFCAAHVAHGFEDMICETGPLAEVNLGIGSRTGDVGIRGKMDDDIMPLHGRGERRSVPDVAAYHPKARIIEMMRVMPCFARREIVVQCDNCYGGIAQQAIREVATDESGATDDEVALRCAYHLATSLAVMHLCHGLTS